MSTESTETMASNVGVVSKKDATKSLAWWRRPLVKVRTYIETIRTKNPKIFDGISNFLQVFWVLLSTFWPSVIRNAWLAGICTCVAFGALYLYQWAILTNRLERAVSIERAKAEEAHQKVCMETEEAIQAINGKVKDVIYFSHSVTHNIKMNISRMPNQDIAITRAVVASFLGEVLNSLEQNLCAHYGQEMCASIKLCSKPNVLKTFARGAKNVACRGGRKKVKKLNQKAIKIGDNYAYSSILKRQLQFFAEGDLRNLTEKENDDDQFYCEYGGEWQELFISTIVIPIRYPILNGTVEVYKMLGVICVDSKEVHPEWSNRTDNYAYQITAFVADAVYSLIDHYMLAQQENKRRGKNERIFNNGGEF